MILSIPKVMGEAEVLNRESSELCAQVMDVRTRLICAEQQSSDAVESLIQLDIAKRRLQEAYKALQEANNWTTLLMDVEEVFDSGDVEQISNKLVSMQQSLEMLSLSSSTATQHSDKIDTLETLKDRFEKIVEPILFESFLNQSSTLVESYSKLFQDLHRSNKLLIYYQTCLRDQLLKEWHTQVKVDAEGVLLNWLSFFFDRLATIWKTQMNFCLKVLYPEDFRMSLTILCDIYTDILQSLDPTIEFCLHQYLEQVYIKQSNSSVVRQKSLIELKQLTVGFVKSIEQNIVQQYSGQPETLDQSIFGIISMDIFLRAVYMPFAKFNQQFLLFEKQRVESEFEQIKFECDTVCSSECVIKLFVLVRDSFKLYCQYVESYGTEVVDEVISQILFKYLSLLRQQIQTSPVNQRLKSSSSNSPNWPLIQRTLFNFQIIGEYLQQLNHFQQQIHLSIQECQSRHSELNPDSISISYMNRFDLFLLNLDSKPKIAKQIETYLESSSEILSPVHRDCVQLAKSVASAICDSILDYVHIFLNNFIVSLQQQLTVGHTDESESVTFSPNEYITQIGQYLLTLPQYLEPFSPSDNPHFKVALKHSVEIFNQHSPLLYSESSECESLLLESILRQTIHAFLDNILQLSTVSKSNARVKLNRSVKKQIGIDLAYLAAVCEDLGLANDKELTLFIAVFTDVHSVDSFWSLLEENPIHRPMLANLEDILLFD